MIERVWQDDGPLWRLARGALLPFSLGFAAVVAARNAGYDRGLLRIRRASVPVISVGNLRVGGTGKTPLVIWLVERLRARGIRVAVVARGYGGAGGTAIVCSENDAVNVARERHARLVVLGGEGWHGAEIGDEALLTALRTGVPVVTCADRYAACETAARSFAPDVIVLDDGFQHRALARDVDIVIVGARDREAWLLPAGPLRETMRALRRAHIVVALDGSGVERRIERRMVGLVTRVDSAAEPEPVAHLNGAAVVAVSGIADNDAFFAMLRDAGASLRSSFGFRDHHRYREKDWEQISRAAGEALRIVTTEKDLVKLARFAPADPRLAALRIDLEVRSGDEFLDEVCVRARLDARGRGQHDRPRPAGS